LTFKLEEMVRCRANVAPCRIVWCCHLYRHLATSEMWCCMEEGEY